MKITSGLSTASRRSSTPVFLLPLLGLLCGACLGTGQAATNRWDATSGLRPDQMSYRWALTKPALAAMPTLTNGVLTFASTGPVTDNYFYLQSGEVLAVPPWMVIEAQVKFISQTTVREDRTPANIAFSTLPGVGNSLWIGPNRIFLLKAPDATDGPSAVVNTDDSFHTYRLEVEGLAAGSAIKVYYDGVLTLSGATYESTLSNGDVARIAWGDGTSYASGVSEWRYVWHNAAAFPAVWGVKSKEAPGPSAPPSTLFYLTEDGSTFQAVGDVTLGGNPIDVDGLSLGTDGKLYGFQVGLPGSRLIKIDKTTAAATLIGTVLTNCDLRGAVFIPEGSILAIDAAQKQVLRVDPSTGNVLGSAVDLQLNTAAGHVADVTDVAQAPDGSFVLAWNYNELYALDPFTGSTRMLHRDAVPDRQGDVVTLAGLAFSRDAANPWTLFAYDVFLQDDLYTYAVDAGFNRALIQANIVSAYNAGRGDLASLPPLPCQIVDFKLAPHSQTVTAVYPGNRFGWVEWKSELSAPAWNILTNSVMSPDPTSGSLFQNSTWVILPAFENGVFFRVGTSLTSPLP